MQLGSMHGGGQQSCEPMCLAVPQRAVLLMSPSSAEKGSSLWDDSNEFFYVQPRVFSRPRRHAPYTNDTLHMFTQRKPNPQHDIYNPPYEGSPKPKAPKNGPDRREQRKARMAAMRKRKDLAPHLAGTRL